MVVVEAIVPDKADFTSFYAVDDQSGTPMAVYRPTDHVFSVTGTNETVYAGIGSQILAFEQPD